MKSTLGGKVAQLGATNSATIGINGEASRREKELPFEFMVSIRVFSGKRAREYHFTVTGNNILCMY
ncbi:MAG: hypothetical protein KZQ76_11365 [Candidatus Thiodiazotropha sp. (ex Epidulcina cf. delphinae)]|nr:hypothetical protein [Candidatus Thiodiazotropha sp. (ex Epidulcina cf. delphinae)]